MNFKSLFVILVLLSIAMEIQMSRNVEDRLVHSMMKKNQIIRCKTRSIRLEMNNEIENGERRIRSFGCKGMRNRNENRCRLHCRSVGYKTGFCSAFTNFENCICSRSSNAKSRKVNLFPVLLNISRL